MKVYIGFLLTASFASVLALSPPLILTDLIKQNKLEEARSRSAVMPSLFLNRTSYSGFFNVDEKHNSNLFFWFIEAENHRPDTPWIIWLQGGPGASSLAGQFDEIGPFEFSAVENKVAARQWTWGKDHSLLFIDNPVGAGFSFTGSPDGYVKDIETCANHLHSVLRQFLTVFPELRKAPLYIAGESYAGRYIPALGLKILEQEQARPKNDKSTKEVDFQGIILGNPVINRESIADYSAIYYHWGLIDGQGLLAVKPLQDAYNKALENNLTDEAHSLRLELLNKLDSMSMQQNDYNVLRGNTYNLDKFVEYITQDAVREALHVGNAVFDFSSKMVKTNLKPDFLVDITWKVETLLNNDYRILIYCGQLDLTAPCVLNARARRKYWDWKLRAEFLDAPRTPWWYNDEVAGYVKSGGFLTEVLVRDAGHLAPIDKPAEVMTLITHFIQRRDLPLPPTYKLPKDTPKYVDDDIEGFHYGYQLLDNNSRYGPMVGMVVSIVINVLLLIVIVCGVLYVLRWKRRHFSLLNIDETSLDSTMIYD